MKWNQKQPIYQQVKDKIAEAILAGNLKEEEVIPSIRQLSIDYQLNPLTVTKAYQLLVENKILEKRRGIGMFIKKGARELLLKQEKQLFLKEEWPLIKKKINQLNLTIEELLK